MGLAPLRQLQVEQRCRYSSQLISRASAPLPDALQGAWLGVLRGCGRSVYASSRPQGHGFPSSSKAHKFAAGGPRTAHFFQQMRVRLDEGIRASSLRDSLGSYGVSGSLGRSPGQTVVKRFRMLGFTPDEKVPLATGCNSSRCNIKPQMTPGLRSRQYHNTVQPYRMRVERPNQCIVPPMK